MPRKKKTSWAERFKYALEHQPFIIFITVLVIAISQITTLIKGADSFLKYYSSTYGWRSEEEAKINKLSASINISKFQEILGAPLFLRKSGTSGEYIFKRQGYWVQAITDDEGSVDLYAVTSCDETFKPRIRNSPSGRLIQLRETTFKKAHDGDIPRLHYFISGATANSYFFEGAYLANPGNYQTIFWGYNDACSNNWDEETGLYHVESHLEEYESGVNTEQSVIDIFRSKNSFNTFAVSSPSADIEELLEEFQIGVDRIQARVYRPVEESKNFPADVIGDILNFVRNL